VSQPVPGDSSVRLLGPRSQSFSHACPSDSELCRQVLFRTRLYRRTKAGDRA
jgi:hypothetical protein